MFVKIKNKWIVLEEIINGKTKILKMINILKKMIMFKSQKIKYLIFNKWKKCIKILLKLMQLKKC